MTKIDNFEYIMWRLSDWYARHNNVTIEQSYNHFDRLRCISLLFFVSTIEAEGDNVGLLDIFDNYYAMPYGHIEGDVYKAIRCKPTQTNIFYFNPLEMVAKGDVNFADIDPKVDSAIDKLISVYPELIAENTSLQLVGLSRRHFSWRYYFNEARKKDIYVEKVPVDILIKQGKEFVY